jgi:hypothetical protein
MRNLITIVFVFISVLTFGQTEREVALFNEVNNFRSNPKSYIPLVENFIKIQESCIEKVKNGSMVIKSGNGNLDKDNKMYNIKSLNGLARIKANIKAANELLVILDTLVLDTVVFDINMYMVTRIHNTHIDSIKRLGHFGINGGISFDRFKGTGYYVNESLATLSNIGDTLNFKGVILRLLVDAGIEGRGHRKMLINPKDTHCSVGISSYQKTSRGFVYNSDYCVINLGHKKGGY